MLVSREHTVCIQSFNHCYCVFGFIVLQLLVLQLKQSEELITKILVLYNTLPCPLGEMIRSVPTGREEPTTASSSPDVPQPGHLEHHHHAPLCPW